MHLLRVSVHQGPNLWAKVSALETLVDCGVWQHATIDDLLGCEKRLNAWLPGLTARNGASTARKRQPSGLAAAALLLEVVLELQSVCRTPVTHGRATAADGPGVYRIVVPFIEEKLARACLEVACRCCTAALNGADFDAPTELAQLKNLAESVCLGGLTGPIVAA